MKTLFTLIACCAAAAAAAVVLSDNNNSKNDVVNYKVVDSDIERMVHEALLNPRAQKKAPRLGKYVFKNCGNPATDLANVSSVVLGPDPVVFPGDISVSFDITIKKTLDAPLKGALLIQKKYGSSWIDIPCIGVVGSCKYPDVCELLQNAVCPDPFTSRKIPCKCPFTQGHFILPATTFTVEVPVFPTGDYHIQGNLTSSGARVACVDLLATVG